MNKDFAERIRFPMPTSELERRWKLVREAMGSQGIDLLVMQNDNLWLGGYVRYFTDIPAEHAYPVSVLFPLDDEMTIITSSSPRGPLPPAWSVRGVKNRIGTPYIRTLNYSNTLDAEAICKIIKERKDKVVGLVNLGLINTVLSSYLKDNLPNVQFVDAADLVDEIKAVKSEVELGFIRKAVEMHDTICEAMPLIVYPGVYEYQVRNQIKEILCNLGSEEQLIKLGSAPAGVSTPFLDTFMQNRQIREGDYFRIMVEASGPAGYYRRSKEPGVFVNLTKIRSMPGNCRRKFKCMRPVY
jgi:Xaa-Pro aminopeptidase